MDASSKQIARALTANPIFGRLSPAALEATAAVSERLDLRAGGLIVGEGEQSADLFLLVSGTAVAVRVAGDGGLVDLNNISAGDCIGELTFLEGGRRTTSVTAETDCALIHIPIAALRRHPDAEALIGELRSVLASVVVHRVRALSDEMLAALRRELEVKTLQNQFGHFLVFTISIFLVSTVLFYMVAEQYVQDVYDPGFSWQAVLFLAVPCLLTIKVMKIPLADLGIKREGLWRSFRDAGLICLAATVPVAVYLLAFKEDPGPGAAGATVDAFFLIQYLAHSLFQEIGSRGLLQGLFHKFLNDTRGHRAIFLTSVVFASLHITFGIDAVLITFVASIALGYVYLKQKNLIGVTLLHYWFGVLAAVVVAF